jgi:regulator of replication initiation timing
LISSIPSRIRSRRSEHGESESIEFVPKRDLDRAQQEVERLRRQSERLQKENERLKQEAERLRRELLRDRYARGEIMA